MELSIQHLQQLTTSTSGPRLNGSFSTPRLPPGRGNSRNPWAAVEVRIYETVVRVKLGGRGRRAGFDLILEVANTSSVFNLLI